MKTVEEILEFGQAYCSGATVDADLELSGWQQFRAEAEKTRDRYFSQLQTLLDTYGIEDEASLVSGHILIIRNRICDHEKEDFSFFNTDKVVALRYCKTFLLQNTSTCLLLFLKKRLIFMKSSLEVRVY